MTMSAKIQIGDGGVPLFNEWELTYDATTQPTYRTFVGMDVSQPEPKITWHSPDNGEDKVVKANPQNKVIRLTMDVMGDDRDAIIQSLSILKRALSGADSQASRNSIRHDTDKVRVAIKPSGVTLTTYYDVIYGVIDDSGAYYDDIALENVMAHEVVFYLTVGAYGYGDSFTLKNDLKSSPHMIEDTDSNGLADVWDTTASVATLFTIATNFWVTGGMSQRMGTDSSTTHRLRTKTVSVTAGSDIVAYTYVRVEDGGDEVQIDLNDGTGKNIQRKTLFYEDSTGVSDSSVMGYGGRLFYKVSLSGINESDDCYLQIVRPSSLATAATVVRVDMVYIQTDATDIPSGFCSSSSLINRYDPTSTSDTTLQRINYLDVAMVPGDAPAILKTKVSYASADADSLTIAKRLQGKNSAFGVPHFFDSSLFNTTATDWTPVVAGTRIGGSYLSCSATAVANRTNEVTFPSSGEPDFMNSPLWCFAVMYTTNANASLGINVSNGGASKLIDDIKPAAINQWSIVDVGVFNLVGLAADASTISSYSFDVQLRAGGSAGNVYVDGLYFLPTHEYLQSPLDDLNTSTNFIRNGAIPETFVQGSDGQYKRQNTLGQMDVLMPGIENRLIFMAKGDNGTPDYEVHDLDTEFTVELTVTPRTSHLLGTM
jgi:hypothetical protein